MRDLNDRLDFDIGRRRQRCAPGTSEHREHRGGDDQDGDAEREALPLHLFLESGVSPGLPAQVCVEQVLEGRVAFVVLSSAL